jgi:uncharacterized RDD family membrane protein YckC
MPNFHLINLETKGDIMYYLKRFLALQVDCIIVGFIFAPVFLIFSSITPILFNYMNNQLFIYLTLALIIIVYFLVSDIVFGRSIGKKIFRMKVVHFKRIPMSNAQIILRDMLRIIDLMLLFTMLILFFNKGRQTLPDIFVKTYVIEEK